jgi:hypothetical protein
MGSKLWIRQQYWEIGNRKQTKFHRYRIKIKKTLCPQRKSRLKWPEISFYGKLYHNDCNTALYDWYRIHLCSCITFRLSSCAHTIKFEIIRMIILWSDSFRMFEREVSLFKEPFIPQDCIQISTKSSDRINNSLLIQLSIHC